jgi:hypothetical protein
MKREPVTKMSFRLQTSPIGALDRIEASREVA